MSAVSVSHLRCVSHLRVLSLAGYPAQGAVLQHLRERPSMGCQWGWQAAHPSHGSVCLSPLPMLLASHLGPKLQMSQ